MTDLSQSNSRPFQPPLLELRPTVAMKNGKQLVWQCSFCGLLAIQTDIAPGALDRCPACDGEHWWQQKIPPQGGHDSLAGFRR